MVTLSGAVALAGSVLVLGVALLCLRWAAIMLAAAERERRRPPATVEDWDVLLIRQRAPTEAAVPGTSHPACQQCDDATPASYASSSRLALCNLCWNRLQHADWTRLPFPRPTNWIHANGARRP